MTQSLSQWAIPPGDMYLGLSLLGASIAGFWMSARYYFFLRERPAGTSFREYSRTSHDKPTLKGPNRMLAVFMLLVASHAIVTKIIPALTS